MSNPATPENETPGRRLRRLRNEKGLYQHQLGDQAGWPQSLISQLERGTVGLRSRAWPDLAMVLGVDLQYLLCRE